MRSLALFLTLFLVFFSACNSQPTPSYASQTPSWVLNPNKDGKRGAVGIAARTYDQKLSSQRKLAITRALDELTLQQGVKVQMSLDKSEVLANERTKTTLNEQSSYSATSTLTAHIEQIYKDNSSGELYIWMLMD
jgi:hypothetical protein